jgi:hypothetical protein
MDHLHQVRIVNTAIAIGCRVTAKNGNPIPRHRDTRKAKEKREANSEPLQSIPTHNSMRNLDEIGSAVRFCLKRA